MAEAKFITFEGGEGAGKSTQAQLLAERLKAHGKRVLVTREPGGSPYAELIRNAVLGAGGVTSSALAEFLMFSAARADHLETTIRPALNAGTWVLCDRFLDSSRVYQGRVGGVDEQAIRDVETHVVGSTFPDLTILLDLPAEVGLQRARQRGETNRIDDNGIEFHRHLRGGFLHLATEEPERICVVDANHRVEAVADDVWAVVSNRLLAEG
jgi:dTMP kinase